MPCRSRTLTMCRIQYTTDNPSRSYDTGWTQYSNGPSQFTRCTQMGSLRPSCNAHQCTLHNTVTSELPAYRVPLFSKSCKHHNPVFCCSRVRGNMYHYPRYLACPGTLYMSRSSTMELKNCWVRTSPFPSGRYIATAARTSDPLPCHQ